MKKSFVFLICIILVFCTCFSLPASAGFIRPGDINSDSDINNGDALTILRHSVGKELIDPTYYRHADVSDDGILNAADALLILKVAGRKIDLFPCEKNIVPIEQEELLIIEGLPRSDDFINQAVICRTPEDFADYSAKITSLWPKYSANQVKRNRLGDVNKNNSKFANYNLFLLDVARPMNASVSFDEIYMPRWSVSPTYFHFEMTQHMNGKNTLTRRVLIGLWIEKKFDSSAPQHIHFSVSQMGTAPVAGKEYYSIKDGNGNKFITEFNYNLTNAAPYEPPEYYV